MKADRPAEQWEYYTWVAESSLKDGAYTFSGEVDRAFATLDEALNFIGSKGWELVSAHFADVRTVHSGLTTYSTYANQTTYTFKRRASPRSVDNAASADDS